MARPRFEEINKSMQITKSMHGTAMKQKTLKTKWRHLRSTSSKSFDECISIWDIPGFQSFYVHCEWDDVVLAYVAGCDSTFIARSVTQRGSQASEGQQFSPEVTTSTAQ